MAATLGWSLSHRWAVMVLATVAVFSSFLIFGKLGSAFMPTADPGQFQVSYKALPASAWSDPWRSHSELEGEIRRNPAVAYTYATIGGTAGKPINEGNIFIRLQPAQDAQALQHSQGRSARRRWRASAPSAPRSKRPTRWAAT